MRHHLHRRVPSHVSYFILLGLLTGALFLFFFTGGLLNTRYRADQVLAQLAPPVPQPAPIAPETVGRREYLYAVSNLIDWKWPGKNPTWAEVRGGVPLGVVFKDSYGMGAVQSPDVQLQYILQTPHGEQAISPTLTSPPYSFIWDSRTVPDGYYVLAVKFIDGSDLGRLRQRLLQLVVDNDGRPPPGAQWVPVLGGFYDDNFSPSKTDWVLYPGAPPQLHDHQHAPGEMNHETVHPNTHPYSYHAVPPAYALPDPNTLVNNNQKWFVDPLIGAINADHEQNPGFYQTPDGHVVTEAFLPIVGTAIERVAHKSIRHDHKDGGRDEGDVCPYSTIISNPNGPGWVGIDVGGRFFRVDPNGAVTTMAGLQTRSDVLQYDYRLTDREVSVEEVKRHQKAVVGNFESNLLFSIPVDLAADPNDPRIFYVADTGNHRIAKVDFHGSTPVITTLAGKAGVAGYKDGPALEAQFNEPYSVAVASDGTIYVADSENSAIRKITPAGLVSTVVGKGPNAPPVPDKLTLKQSADLSQWTKNASFDEAALPYPEELRLDSHGNLIVLLNWTATIHRVDLENHRVEKIFDVPNQKGQWVWLDVDSKGLIGPRDDIVLAMSTSLGLTFNGQDLHNKEVWRISPDGSRAGPLVPRGYPGALMSGNASNVSEPGGHYPWIAAINDTEKDSATGKEMMVGGQVLAGGYGNIGLLSLRMISPSDPVGYESKVFDVGNTIHNLGTVTGFPFGSRPAFAALHGARGLSYLDNIPNFDDLVQLSDTELARYIQDGMGGQVERPEVSGYHLAAYIYFIRKSSLQGHLETINFSKIWENLHNAGLWPDDVVAPKIQSVQVTQVDPTTRQVAWITDEPTISIVKFGPAVAVAAPYGRFSAFEPNYSTSHTIILDDLPSNRADSFHFQIVSKDQAGNFAVSPDALLSGAPAAADVLPPTIAAVTAANLSSAGATISWTTSEPANSQVEYGLTTSYGNNTSLVSSLTSGHTVALRNLLAGTLYHYRVKSKDAAGNPAVSNDYTFMTISASAPPPPPPPTPLTNSIYDLNADGLVNISELGILLKDYSDTHSRNSSLRNPEMIMKFPNGLTLIDLIIAINHYLFSRR